jgi:hypothetical protein
MTTSRLQTDEKGQAIKHAPTIDREGLWVGFAAYSKSVDSIRGQLEAIRRDPCAAEAARTGAAWIEEQLDNPAFATTLTAADWDVLRATYIETLNALKLAAEFGRRLRRTDLVRFVRDAECKLWILVWRRLVLVDGLSQEDAHIRLTLVDQRFPNQRRWTHVA